MKANYPVEFLAASMTFDMANTDKLAEFRAEAVRLGIKVEPPSINRSGRGLRRRDQHAIHYSLCALKGVGPRSGEIDRRRRAETSRSATSRISRAGSIPAPINKRVLESLAAAGAFDGSSRTAHAPHAGVDAILATAQRRARSCRRSGRTTCSAAPSSREQIPLPAAQPWLPAERLQREFDAIGFFLSGHPLDDYAAILKRLKVQRWTAFCNSIKRVRRRAGSPVRLFRAPSGAPRPATRWASSEFSDPSGHYEAVIFQEGLMQYRDLLEPGESRVADADGGSAGRGRARAHPDGRAARRCGRETSEGLARADEHRQAD